MPVGGREAQDPDHRYLDRAPLQAIIADAWLPDPSKFADPADPAYDAYWTGEGNEKGAKSNPKGLPKDPELWPTACRSSSQMAR